MGEAFTGNQGRKGRPSMGVLPLRSERPFWRIPVARGRWPGISELYEDGRFDVANDRGAKRSSILRENPGAASARKMLREVLASMLLGWKLCIIGARAEQEHLRSTSGN